MCAGGTCACGGMPSVEVFLKEPNPYLRDFGESHGKLRTARSTNATEDWTWHLPSTSSRKEPLSHWWGMNIWICNSNAICGIWDRYQTVTFKHCIVFYTFMYDVSFVYKYKKLMTCLPKKKKNTFEKLHFLPVACLIW